MDIATKSAYEAGQIGSWIEASSAGGKIGGAEFSVVERVVGARHCGFETALHGSDSPAPQHFEVFALTHYQGYLQVASSDLTRNLPHPGSGDEPVAGQPGCLLTWSAHPEPAV